MDWYARLKAKAATNNHAYVAAVSEYKPSALACLGASCASSELKPAARPQLLQTYAAKASREGKLTALPLQLYGMGMSQW